ncbi:hypothetical protein Tamer19_33390 [Cupriavidus sp. TA19]|uniref:DUF1097 domain-containing protein n=1 Tax=unclassified Cupriavidus TaxID=2640874 RepID=UPI000E2ECF5B|nr:MULTISPECIES: DUF1097 domain-containing protein [unclassified Cupriavidus]BDB24189.1 DUF1097 domain-containing protein [Cupriavidus sp. P-10]GLC93931.1 hypothetical protein Tamer19_33390 [Cupriavidus sp. TA19]
MSNTSTPAAMAISPGTFHGITLVGAVVAAVTTFVTLAAALPAWAMFLGWVGYNSRGQTVREGLANLVALLLGIVFGAGTALLIGWLTPHVGNLATPLAVFADVVLVLSLRALPGINNPLAYFLGLISFFAAGQPPSPLLLGGLVAAGVLGAIGGGISNVLQGRLAR